MDINTILFIGIPESFLSYLFGLLIWQGREIFKEKKNIPKLLTASIIIPIIMNLLKSHVDSIIATTLLCILIYVIVFKALWKINLRCALINSTVMMMLIMVSEIATVQLISEFIKATIEKYGFFNMGAMALWTFPTRFIQLITIVIVYQLNLTFKNNKFLFEAWDNLSKSEKVIIHTLFRHLIISIILSSCYTQIFKDIMENNISIKLFEATLYLVLLTSIYFLLSSLQLLFRQALLEDLKEIVFRGPRELFKLILESSNEDQIKDYQLQLLEYKKERNISHEEKNA